MNPSRREKMYREIGHFCLHGFLVLLAGLMLGPFLWMVLASFKTNAEIEQFTVLPSRWQTDNYALVLRQMPDPITGRLLELNFPRWFFNSVFVAAWITSLQVMTSALAAYAFSRLRWPGRDKVFFLYLSTLMVPALMLTIPNYQLMVQLGLVNTYAGLILPGAFSAFGTFLLRQFMLGIHPSFDEAAKLDGANHFQIFLDVILPLTRPGLVTLALLTYLGNFQSFFWPLVMVKDDYLRTIPIGLLSFQNEFGQQTELIMAVSVMTVLPLIAFFVVMQRQIIAGIQLGGIKG